MLDISDATVKRTFSIGSFSLERFLKIGDLIDLSFQDLAQLEEQTENKIQFYYTREQEEFLARPENINHFLLYESLNYLMSLEDVVEEFGISKDHLVKLLSGLEKIGLIERLPGNKLKKVSLYPINWIRDGVLDRAYRGAILDDFFEPFKESIDDFLSMDMIYMSGESRKKWESKLKEISLEMKKEMYREQILGIPHDSLGVVIGVRRYVPKMLKDMDFSEF